MSIAVVIELARPKQWIKNLFVLAPLVFSHSFLDPTKFGYSIIAFILFSLAASSIYVFNDIFDLSKDCLHPLKKNRPLARGAIRLGEAILAGIILGAISIFFSAIFSTEFLGIILAYMALNFFYTQWLKHIVIIDLFSVALGFVLRILAGGIAIGVALSPWIIGATFFIAIFIIASKRFQEFNVVSAVPGEEESGANINGFGEASPASAKSYGPLRPSLSEASEARPVLGLYNKDFLRQIIFASLVLTIVVYVLYAFLEVKNPIFIVTILPVIYGLFRFLWITEYQETRSDNPTDILFKDTPLGIAVFIFIILVVLIFYSDAANSYIR